MFKQSFVVTLMLIPALSYAQQSSAAAPAKDETAAQAKYQKSCRSISAEIRSGAPPTREVVIAELLRARAEGELDFHISSTPPAVYRPMCELPPPAQQPAETTKAK